MSVKKWFTSTPGQITLILIVFLAISTQLKHNTGEAKIETKPQEHTLDLWSLVSFNEISVLLSGVGKGENVKAQMEFSKVVEMIADRGYESLSVAMNQGRRDISSQFATCPGMIALINEAADYYRIPRDIAVAVIAKESACSKFAKSNVGAIGPAQIYWVPRKAHTSAAAALGISVNRLQYRSNAKHNIYLGMATLNAYRNELGGSLIAALGAYYAGTTCHKHLSSYQDDKEIFNLEALKDQLSGSQCSVSQKMQVEYTWDIFAYALVYEREILGNKTAGIPYLAEYFEK